MCGIAGEVYWDGQQATTQRLQTMLSTMEKRGPDDSGTWVSHQVGFGHRRLAIIDLSAGGHQPMRDQELTLVFNGCIYNYRALRDQLMALGQVFVSESDTEVVIKAFRQWGMECVQYFEGMFAFAIWDDHQQQLCLARDRFGIKPLYYAAVEGGLRFASNTQALIATGGMDLSIDPVGLHHQFTLHGVIPAPHTILKGIKKLAPGHWLVVNPDGQIYHKQYWHLKAERTTQYQQAWLKKSDLSESELAALSDEEAWIEAVHLALRDAVAKRLTASDVPVGVLLSGGLDSSLIVALLAEAGVENIHTFSIGFEDIGQEEGSEFVYSDQVVKAYNTVHQKYQVPNEVVLPRLNEAIAAMSEPMFGQDAIAFYLLSEQVSQSVKVVMSGQGADEVFAGYFWYPQMAEAAQRDPEGSPLSWFEPYYFDRTHSEWCDMIAAPFQVENVTAHYIQDRLSEPGATGFLDQVLRLDASTLIVDDPVKRVDNMTMAWSLEARVPFLDHDLVALVMSAPESLKLKDFKYLLKKIARGRVPDSVIDRPKGYFPMPALKYVRGPFYDMMKSALTSEAAVKRGLFKADYLAKLLANPEAAESFTRIQGSKLWHAALLELWLQQHVDPFNPVNPAVN